MLNLEKYLEIIYSGIYGDSNLAVKAARLLLKEIKNKAVHDMYGEIPDFDGDEIWPDESDFKFKVKTKTIDLEGGECTEIITGLTVVRA